MGSSDDADTRDLINNADGIFEPLGIVTSIPMYLE
jgi:hypothetical protein